MRIAGTIKESVVDGPGIRWTVFTQGCLRNCPGCQNPHTHDPNGGTETTIEQLMNEIPPHVHGITISGGEPFLQPAECTKLAKEVHLRGMTVWVYTGDTIENIIKENDPLKIELLRNTDVLVDGPFHIEWKTQESRFRGSKNQRLVDVKKTLEGTLTLWEH